MIATSIEQSKKLLELDIDPKTTDMYYPYLGNEIWGNTPRVGKPIEFSSKKDIPAWSLTALLEIIRKQDGILDLIFLPSTFDGRGNRLTDVWRVSFDGIEKGTDLYGNTLIEICVQMIEWLCKNGYMSKEGER